MYVCMYHSWVVSGNQVFDVTNSIDVSFSPTALSISIHLYRILSTDIARFITDYYLAYLILHLRSI